jgi:hypothetical protein
VTGRGLPATELSMLSIVIVTLCRQFISFIGRELGSQRFSSHSFKTLCILCSGQASIVLQSQGLGAAPRCLQAKPRDICASPDWGPQEPWRRVGSALRLHLSAAGLCDPAPVKLAGKIVTLL